MKTDSFDYLTPSDLEKKNKQFVTKRKKNVETSSLVFIILLFLFTPNYVIDC